jgi:hypothetical protein
LCKGASAHLLGHAQENERQTAETITKTEKRETTRRGGQKGWNTKNKKARNKGNKKETKKNRNKEWKTRKKAEVLNISDSERINVLKHIQRKKRKKNKGIKRE